jgi:TRAP-type C4-dicarboxylate transport system substrate-binding protein
MKENSHKKWVILQHYPKRRDFQFYHNLQLGSEPSTHSQLRSGALELLTTSV